MSVLVIAEAGVNHNGQLDIAKKLVDAAIDANVNCIKFQTFKASNIATKSAEKASYQKQLTDANETQYEMLKKLELSYDDFIEINEYCKLNKIEFLSTAFDFESIDFLQSLDMKRWKIPSGEITNLPYLIKIANLKKPIILSTGMSTLKEVEDALTVLKNNGARDITVLHCTTEYPAPYESVNLAVMKTLAKTFDVEIGYSDHTKGIEIPIAATALGASIIEKHFTLDCEMEGPDHLASIEPKELKEMILAIRNVELAIGSGIKKPTLFELENAKVARKSIVAKHNINKGDLFTENNLTTKRPGTGINPMKWFELLGTTSKRSFHEGELIEE